MISSRVLNLLMYLLLFWFPKRFWIKSALYNFFISKLVLCLAAKREVWTFLRFLVGFYQPILSLLFAYDYPPNSHRKWRPHIRMKIVKSNLQFPLRHERVKSMMHPRWRRVSKIVIDFPSTILHFFYSPSIKIKTYHVE